MMKQIEIRYQYWSKDGIVWTEWFRDYTNYDNEEKAKVALDRMKALSAKQKLKHEYRIVDYVELPEIKHVDPLGLYIGGLKKIERIKKAKVTKQNTKN